MTNRREDPLRESWGMCNHFRENREETWAAF